jgi:hypothetical protein
MAFSDKDIYKKSGKPNFREKNMLDDLRSSLDKRAEKDPNFSFSAAENYQELKALHEEFAIESASFEEQNTNDIENAHKKFRDSSAQSIEKDSDDEESYQPEIPDEPFTESNPEVRDYVMDSNSGGGSSFDFKEPASDDEAFNFDDTPQASKIDNNNPQAQQKAGQPKKDAKKAPLNPDYDEMSNKAKNKQTKNFAHFITEAVAGVSQQAFIYLTTKNITDDKLVEMELTGSHDLSREVEVENQTVTIKEFLQYQRQLAIANSTITETEKLDLKNALADVMQEKGFTPTPTQNLAIVAGGIGIRLLSVGIQVSSACNSVLEQIRVKNPTPKKSYYKAPSHEEEALKAQQQSKSDEAQKRQQQQKSEPVASTMTGNEDALIDEDDLLLNDSETGVATKE